ncbi:MAG: hypothetical protein IJB65_07880 [Clostridia bacterium]|nr:hypothetical protein [Clostridia bacterium]
MKKFLCLFLISSCIATSFAACGKNEEAVSGADSSVSESSEITESSTVSVEESSFEAESTSEAESEFVEDSSEESGAEDSEFEDSLEESSFEAESTSEAESEFIEDSSEESGAEDSAFEDSLEESSTEAVLSIEGSVSEEAMELVGYWTDGVGDSFIFSGDGTGKLKIENYSQDLVWSATADTISIKVDFGGQIADYCKDTPYTINGDELIITMAYGDVVFKKA